MAKGKNNDLMPTLAGVFSLFAAFLYCLSLLQSFSLGGLLMPSLWLLLGLCLLTRKKNWLCVVGMLPLTILTAMGAWGTIPTGSVEVFLRAIFCTVLPAVGFVLLWILLLLACMQAGRKFRRSFWLFPILFMLPMCILQNQSALVWAQFGMVACTAFWIKPAGK